MGIAVSPQIHPQVAEFIDKPRKMLINGQWVEAASGKTFPTYNPGHRRSPGASRRRRSRRHRPAVKAARAAFDNGPWRRMTASERGRLIWKLADLLEQHTEEFALSRNARQRQAAERCARRRTSRSPSTCSATWRDGPPRLKATRFRFRSLHAGRQVSRLHSARAGGRGRPDHPVEFPAADGGLEAGAGAGYGLHRRAEAGGADSALRAASRRTDSGSRHSRRRGQHRPGLWRNRGRCSGRASGCRQSRLHRLDGSRQADRAGGGRQSEESVAGTGRQVSQRRFQRRRS